MESRISFITLGVSDLDVSREFYRRLLGKEQLNEEPGVAFFEMGKTWLALWSREELAKDTGFAGDEAANASQAGSGSGGVGAAGEGAGDEGAAGASRGFPGFALAHNVRSEAEVDAVLEEAQRAGGRLVKAGQKAFWGGYTGYFADPDGFLWEVAWNPGFPHV